MIGTGEFRARRLFLGLLVLLGLLVGRAGYIQLVRGEELAHRASRQHFLAVDIPAPRGRLVDRQGRALAVSYHARTIAADPQLIEDTGEFASRVAFLLGEPDAALGFARLLAARKDEGKRFVYLRRRVDREIAARVEEAGIPGVVIREEPRREYPHGRNGAAVLGVVGADAEGRVSGLTGLESIFDAQLRGRDGIAFVLRSGRHESLHLYPEKDREPEPGRDLELTIDITLQEIVEEALDGLEAKHHPRTACAIVLDPRTGEVLALGNRPAFDPADFPAIDPQCLRLHAVQDAFEPGSTVKPLIVARALTCRVVRPGQLFDCGPGVKYFGGRRLQDVRPNHTIDLEHVLIKSSNIGMAQVGQALGCDRAFALLGSLGFGRKTGIEATGEQCGKVTERRKWHPDYTLVSVSMGHEVLVTPIQLAVAHAALLNGGRLVRPTLVRDARRPPEPPGDLALDTSALAFVRRAMEEVVEEGTGKRAVVEGVRIGGKTGTAEKYPEGSRRYVSSFVGFAPAQDPRLLVLILADEPQAVDGIRPYGGVVAAPVAGEILRRAIPLLDQILAPSEPGVRQKLGTVTEGKVRVAAVHRSSVWAGEGDSPVASRNPDSEGEGTRRSGGG
ncbi:MAG TPA: penicillin-binding protein 2 [Planctomycetota bacterium]|nr:penicillin-binding protein 2 [Planctomycetota bacterium]